LLSAAIEQLYLLDSSARLLLVLIIAKNASEILVISHYSLRKMEKTQ